MADSEGGRRNTSAETFQSKVSKDPAVLAKLEARNSVRQADLLLTLIAQAKDSTERFRLRLTTITDLNRVAMEDLVDFAGHIRVTEISNIGTSQHKPPSARDVVRHLEEFLDYVDSKWDSESALHLSAYVMWRLNWIHPFVDGNGRTSRAASYLVLCARGKGFLLGDKTIPDRITESVATRAAYYSALEKADEAWKKGTVDVSELETLLGNHAAAQTVDGLARRGPHGRSPTPPTTIPVQPAGEKPPPHSTGEAFWGVLWRAPVLVRALVVTGALVATGLFALWASLPDAEKHSVLETLGLTTTTTSTTSTTTTSTVPNH